MAEQQNEPNSTVQELATITITIPTLNNVCSNVFRILNPNENYKVVTTFPAGTLYQHELPLPDQCISTILRHPLSRVKYDCYFEIDQDNYRSINVGEALYNFASSFVTLVNKKMLYPHKFLCKIVITTSPLEDIMVSIVYEPNMH